MRGSQLKSLALVSGLALALSACASITGDVAETGNEAQHEAQPAQTFLGLFSLEPKQQKSKAQTAIADAVQGPLKGILKESDLSRAIEAQSDALNASAVTSSVSWTNIYSGNQGEVRSGPVYYVNNRPCRDFTHKMEVEDQLRTVSGAACLHDETWRSL
ncbi:RT0821/Lpp0805 family surface protein [Polycladidibacter hongkongensis]|uniref:RT0821/Lpp0805 family surface protein n=1 Tax=Polycladidibacter hongkongensis TaxID=1647556 RepID=UPI00082BC01E|nr:RT0821/Lpp0805 family surface protein [Pseudovibrio hongkongensis]